jgi:hypothetical protein
MQLKPSLRRAWSPLIYQLAGILVICVASVLPFGRWDMIGVFIGLCLWLWGAGKKRLSLSGPAGGERKVGRKTGQ